MTIDLMASVTSKISLTLAERVRAISPEDLRYRKEEDGNGSGSARVVRECVCACMRATQFIRVLGFWELTDRYDGEESGEKRR